MQMKMCLVMPGWAEMSGSQSRGSCVWGLPLRVPGVGGFMGPSPSVLLSQVLHLQHTRAMNWGHGGERSFLEDVWDLRSSHEAAEEPWICRHAEFHHLCLSYDYCHWHPIGGWVLRLYCIDLHVTLFRSPFKKYSRQPFVELSYVNLKSCQKSKHKFTHFHYVTVNIKRHRSQRKR